MVQYWGGAYLYYRKYSCLSEWKYNWPSCVFNLATLGAKSRLSTWPPGLLPLCPGESPGPGLLIGKFLNVAGLPVTGSLTLPMTFLNQSALRDDMLAYKKERIPFQEYGFFCLSSTMDA